MARELRKNATNLEREIAELEALPSQHNCLDCGGERSRTDDDWRQAASFDDLELPSRILPLWSPQSRVDNIRTSAGVHG
jgi:hypothetical protein